MDRMIYLSMSGAKATMQRQETLANNLANVSTVGFRAELAAFRAVPVQGSGASTRVYALESTPGYDPTPGQVAATGRNLDVAMKGSAWLAVQGLDGTEAYTRGGSLQTDAEGNLGVLQAGALEESNVDLTAELVNMIVAQRSYQANAQTIKTQDQILQAIVNLR